MKSIADFGPMRERDQLEARDPKRKKMILEYKSTTPGLSTSDIAVKAGCTLNYVSRVLKAEQLLQQRQQPHQAEVPEAGHGAQESCESWFQRIVETNLLDLKAALRTSLRGNPQQIQRWTTKVEAPSRIRHITASELDANTFPYDLSSTDTAERKRGSDWLRHHFSGEKKSSQGFVIMDAHTGSDGKQSEALFKALPTLLDEPSYAKEFKPIFQSLQEKGEKTKGDAKRRQAKMTELTKKAQLRVKEATYLLRRKGNSTNGSAKQREAEQTLVDVRKEYKLVKEVIREMGLGYNRISQAVSRSPRVYGEGSARLRGCACLHQEEQDRSAGLPHRTRRLWVDGQARLQAPVQRALLRLSNRLA